MTPGLPLSRELIQAHRRLVEREIRCRRCPRLVAWREAVARAPRAAFREWTYWARPVPGCGDPRAWLWIVGLAPAAHGGNRTGRVFTGDRSGEWLFAALHRAGFANQRHAEHRDDGLQLQGAFVSAVARCAPPDNRPTPAEMDACRPYLRRELELLRSTLRVIVALGGIAFEGVLRLFVESGGTVARPRPRFGHGAVVALPEWDVSLVGSYHPSQQNTFTGRLTEAMLDDVFRRALEIRGAAPAAGTSLRRSGSVPAPRR